MLAIAGGKGGSGKTTTALGLARAFVRRGCEPLVVDADADMPDVHHAARIERRCGVDVLAEEGRPERAVQRSPALPGVALATAGTPEKTATALRAARSWDGPVLVDCPAGVGPDATCPLRMADATLVVSTDEPQSLEDGRRTVTVARQLGGLPAGVVLRTTVGTGCVDRVGGCRVLASVPSVAEPFGEPACERVWDALAETLGGVATPRNHVG